MNKIYIERGLELEGEKIAGTNDAFNVMLNSIDWTRQQHRGHVAHSCFMWPQCKGVGRGGQIELYVCVLICPLGY